MLKSFLKSVYIYIYIYATCATLALANPTGAELKKPSSTAFDFTFQSPQNKIQETLEDMIKIEIGKETFLTRRNSNIWDCKMDQFGTAYCPSELKNASIVSSPLPVDIKTVNHTIYDEKVANVFYVGFNLGLQEQYCSNYDRNNEYCISYAWKTVDSFKPITGASRYGYNGTGYSSLIYTSYKIIGSCPAGTTQEGNQCKGTNYICPAGYTDNGSNCKKTITYSCNSNLITPVLLDGSWKCGSLVCDGNMKCGYGVCDLPSKPSLDKYMDVAYNPLQYITNNQCNSDICDYTINAKVSYCESKQCPKGDDIIQKDGKCYKLECPAGTYLSGDKCIKSNY